MIPFAALLLATIVAIELCRGTDILRRFATLPRAGRRAGRLLVKTRVTEARKERAVQLMARRLFALSASAGGALLLVASPFALTLALDRVHPLGIAHALTDWPVRIWLLVLTTAYALARRASTDRLLHRIALGSPTVLEASFDIERSLFLKTSPRSEGTAPVFVTGLARAGTTILMRTLHESGAFAALTYRDLPFALAPNVWARLSGGASRKVEAIERGHGDGILHDLDSPEAIEELFWLAHEGAHYRSTSSLAPLPPAPDTIAAFRAYVALVMRRYRQPRYLSKNNNNLLRMHALIEAFPDAVLLHPFRDPIQQAASLLTQHKRACELAGQYPYRADFMRWLGHHEFGADHRPFLLPGAPTAADDATVIDHWLKLWIAAYRFLLRQPEEVRRRQVFVDYDALCHETDGQAAMLTARLKLDRPFSQAGLRAPPIRPTTEADPLLVAEAMCVHAELVTLCRAAYAKRTSAVDENRAVA